MISLITVINGQYGSYLSAHNYTFESMLGEMIDYWLLYFSNNNN